MSMNELADFCRRVGISVNAGLGLIDSIKREAPRQRSAKIWLDVVQRLEDGDSLAESLQPHQRRLGEMFVALIDVGEQSGHLGEMFNELADYYDEMLKIRRDFLKSLILPAMELGAAIVIIGIIILVLGFLQSLTGADMDILGFGLVGVSGFIKYVVFLSIVGATGTCLYFWVKQSVNRSRAVHYFLDRIPKIGKLFRLLALMKLTWGMHLTMRTGMDVRRALKLSFQGVRYAPVSDNLPIILDVLQRGGSLTDAFLSAKHLDGDLVTSVDTGEQSGSLPELMHKMSQRYLQESLLQLKIVSTVGAFVVYGCIMAVIAFMIFRIAMFYIGMLNDAAAGI